MVTVSVIGVLVGLLLPAVQNAREAARRVECANNLRQLALAAQGFHTATGSFPPARAQNAVVGDTWGHIARLLPYIEQNVVFKGLDLSKPINDSANMDAWTAAIPVLRCPSDTNRLFTSNSPLALPSWTKNNYRGNGGNDTGEVNSAGVEKNNGVFVAGRKITIAHIADGTSNTALFSEAVLGDGDDNVISKPGDWFAISPVSHDRKDIYAALQAVTPASGSSAQVSYGGREYLTGQYLVTRYNHIMLPNGPSGVVPNGTDLITAINTGAQATTASSGHPGGVNLALADGAVRFIKNEIDITTWWSLGSICGHDDIVEKF